MNLKLSGEEIERLITLGFGAEQKFFHVEELRPGFVRIRMPFRKRMLRPGNVVSGPALFTAADLAIYAIVLAHVGPELMAVTANLTINFLNKAQPGDIIGEATLLKLGRKLAVVEVRLRCGDDPTIVAHVTGSYSLPGKTAQSTA
jgi:uncharacterized protein (TIGR00369 family)